MLISEYFKTFYHNFAILSTYRQAKSGGKVLKKECIFFLS